MVRPGVIRLTWVSLKGGLQEQAGLASQCHQQCVFPAMELQYRWELVAECLRMFERQKPHRREDPRAFLYAGNEEANSDVTA